MEVESALQCILQAPVEAISRLPDLDKVLRHLQTAIPTPTAIPTTQVNETQSRKRKRSSTQSVSLAAKLSSRIIKVVLPLWSLAVKEEEHGVVYLWEAPMNIVQRGSWSLERQLLDSMKIDGNAEAPLKDRLIRGLAHRSFALQYESYRRAKDLPSKVDEHVGIVPKSGRGTDDIPSFVKKFICDDKHTKYAIRCMRSGLKALAQERYLAQELQYEKTQTTGLSAITYLAFQEFKALPISGISEFINYCKLDFQIKIAKKNEEEGICRSIIEIIDLLSPWYNELQTFYDELESLSNVQEDRNISANGFQDFNERDSDTQAHDNNIGTRQSDPSAEEAALLLSTIRDGQSNLSGNQQSPTAHASHASHAADTPIHDRRTAHHSSAEAERSRNPSVSAAGSATSSAEATETTSDVDDGGDIMSSEATSVISMSGEASHYWISSLAGCNSQFQPVNNGSSAEQADLLPSTSHNPQVASAVSAHQDPVPQDSESLRHPVQYSQGMETNQNYAYYAQLPVTATPQPEVHLGTAPLTGNLVDVETLAYSTTNEISFNEQSQQPAGRTVQDGTQSHVPCGLQFTSQGFEEIRFDTRHPTDPHGFEAVSFDSQGNAWLAIDSQGFEQVSFDSQNRVWRPAPSQGFENISFNGNHTMMSW